MNSFSFLQKTKWIFTIIAILLYRYGLSAKRFHIFKNLFIYGLNFPVAPQKGSGEVEFKQNLDIDCRHFVNLIKSKLSVI